MLVLQAGEEGFQVHLVGDVPLALEVAHPVHGLLDVAPGGQHELVEETQEIHPGEERLDELGVQIEVLVPQLISPRLPRPPPTFLRGFKSWNLTISL